jgi:biopolymer transport protein ExbB/TolQ
MSQEVWLWILSGILGVLASMIAVIWSLLRAEQKAQDDAIEEVRKHKADKDAVEDAGKRVEKEIDRIKFEHERVIDRVELRFEREMVNMESRLCTKIAEMEANVIRQIELMMEILKKDK